MAKVTRVIKGFLNLSDEERQEFLDTLQKEEEVVIEDKPKEEPKEDVIEEVKKEEPKEPEKKPEDKVEEPKKEELDFQTLYNELKRDFKVVVEEVKTLKEQKATEVGLKAKPKAPSAEYNFDSIYAQLKPKKY